MRESVVLLGWELGQGFGHVVKAQALSRVLKLRGIRTVFAVSNVDAAVEIGLARDEVRQAPRWPMQIGAWKVRRDYVPATLGEFLAQAIFSDADAIAAQIEGWRALAHDIRPDVVVADYAPGLHLALRDRVPIVAFSVGYCLPPADRPEFPRIGSLVRPLHEPEEAVLGRINEALRRTGGTPLAHYPQVFSAEAHAVLSPPLFDPYQAHRPGTQLGPVIPKRPPLRVPGTGLFVYLWENARAHDWIIEGIARAGGPGLAYIPRLDEGTAGRLAAAGLTVLRAPADLGEAFASAGVVVHHGGHGTACAALAAGLPQVMVSYDQEKKLTASSLEALGVCRHVPIAVANPRAIHQAITEMRESADARRRARALAVENAPWFDVPAETRVADLVEKLLGRP